MDWVKIGKGVQGFKLSKYNCLFNFYAELFFSHLVVSDSLLPHGPQHARSPCPNRLILCCPLLRLPSIFSSTRVFSKESVLCIRWPKYWSCSFSISPANEYSEYLGWTGSISLLPKRLSRVSSNTTVQKHRFFDTLLSYSPTLTSIHDYWKNHSFD